MTSVEKYKTRAGTQDEGKDYEFEMTALLALRSLQLAKNVSIAFNVEGVGDFDDIVLMLTTKDDERVNFLLQLKHKADPNNLTRKELEEPDGKLPFNKYCEHMTTIKKDVKITKKQGTITNRFDSFGNIFFVLFTNRGMDINKFEENKYLFFEIDKNDEKTIFLKKVLKTSEDDDCVFKFVLSDFPNKVSPENGENFTNFRLFTNQINFKDLHQEIAQEIKKIGQLFKKGENEIADEFIKYIKSWAKGLLGDHYYLTKQDIVFKLTELYLSQYEVNLRSKPFQDYDSEKKIIWNELLSHQSVTIVEANEMVLNFLIQFISNEVGKYSKGTNWKDNLTKKEQQAFYKNFDFLKAAMLKTVGNTGKISLVDIYKCVWRAQKIPLLLQVENLEEYGSILKILELSNFSYKVIILNATSKPLSNQEGAFLSLKDLSNEKREMVLDQPALVQGRVLPKLGDILEESMFEEIKTKDVIRILSGNFCIGKKINPLPEYFIPRNTSKIFLKPQIFDYPTGDDKFYVENEVRHDSSLFITKEELENRKNWENFHVCSINGFDLEWKRTLGLTEKIKSFKNSSRVEYESNISYYSSNPTNIISEVPGMGKSIFMDYVARETPTTKWVLRIDLNQHLFYYRKSKNPNIKSEEHLNYFFDWEKNDLLSKKVFEKLLQTKSVIVLLDGFDEISITNKDDVTKIAKSLQKGGFHIWLTTRPHMLEHLEENLNTFAISLQPFTKENQKQFLKNFFKNKTQGCEKRIAEFVEGLLKATEINLYDYEAKFTGVPLQTELLADYFLEKLKSCLGNFHEITFNEKFDLLNLYQNIIDKKIDVLELRFNHDQTALAEADRCRPDQPLLALELVFPLDEFEEVEEIKEKFDYYKKKFDKKQHLQRDGVLTIDEKFDINCNHRSIAEFQAAQWLKNNLDNGENLKELVHDLIKERFSKNYQFLFNIFDRSLAQNCVLHLAVICNQLIKVKEIINENNIQDEDEGGRTILHILALYGDEEELKDILEIIKKIPNLNQMSSKRDKLGFTALDYALGNKSPLKLANALSQGQNLAPIKAYIELNLTYTYLTTCEDQGLKPLFDLLLPYFLSRDLLQNNIATDTNLKTYLRNKSFDTKSKYVSNIVAAPILKFMQQNGLDYTKYSNNYYSDLRYAIRFGNKKNIEEVIKKSKEINEKDVDKNTPLFYGILNENLETVQILLEKGSDINKKNSENRTALHLALQTKNSPLIQYLLTQNPNYNAVDNKGQNILHYAFIYNYYDTIEDLIEKVDMNKQDNKGNTPLHLAFKANQINLAKLLIEKGADVKILNYEKNQNALHYAILYDTDNIIDKGLFKNVDPNIPDLDGNTPLHLELQNSGKNIATVNFLFEIGADVTIQNLRKETALHVVINNPHSLNSIIKLIIDQGANVNTKNNSDETAIHCAIKSRKIQIARNLISKLNDANQSDCYGDTCLHLAAKNGYWDILEYLISRKGNFNGVNDKNETPLHLAVASEYSGSEETIQGLLNEGVAVNRKDKSGNTPLHLAVLDKKLFAVNLLVSKGANVNITNNRRQSPLQLATENEKMYKVLFKYAENETKNVRGRVRQ